MVGRRRTAGFGKPALHEPDKKG